MNKRELAYLVHLEVDMLRDAVADTRRGIELSEKCAASGGLWGDEAQEHADLIGQANATRHYGFADWFTPLLQADKRPDDPDTQGGT